MKLHNVVRFGQSFTFNQRCVLNFQITNSLKLRGRVRFKHSNILIVICTYYKYINVSVENATCTSLGSFFLSLQSWQGLNNFFLELDAAYRVIVYQVYKKLEGEIKLVNFWEDVVCFAHISQHIFISVYIKLLWKIYYYRLYQGFIVLRFVFCQLVQDTQR